jgi:glycerate dehydrogenase
LQELGACTIYDRTPAALTLARAEGAEILLTNKVLLDAATLAQLPELRFIGVLATGYNIVDVAAAKARNIVVSNVPGYGTPSVVQMTFALLLELANQVGLHTALTRSGRWSSAPDFCFWEKSQRELAGLTLGIIGYGAIGRGVAQVARALGMDLLVHTRSPEKDADAGVRYVDLDLLLSQSDVVSLHCPLTESTRQMINGTRLAQMKNGALLINTARGLLVDEEALASALNRGALAGAALDTLATEPPPADHPLLLANNCIVTPHIAWATHAARRRLLAITVENILSFCAGTPQNRVA